MAKFKTFPHYKINVKDESLTTPLVVEDLSLHRPIFFLFAEKGPINSVQYGDYSALVDLYGDGTFDIFSDYYKHPTLFAEKCLNYNKAFVVRLAPEDAEASSLVLECAIYEGDVPLYTRDPATHELILDANGNKQETGSTATGIVVDWKVRALEADENPKALTSSTATVTIDEEDVTVTTYPILVFAADSPGAWANTSGFKFYWNEDSDTSVAADMEAIIYTLGFVATEWDSDTALPVRTKYVDAYTEVTFAENTVDKATMRRYNINEVIDNEYDSLELGITVYNYPDNVKAIGEACLAVEDDTIFPELTSAHMVNIITCASLSQNPYIHIVSASDIVVSSDDVIFNSSVIHYLTGGDDGTLSDENLESLTRDWLGGSVFPDIADKARYPITHLYDSGYELDTKEALIDFVGIRDDVKIILGTQSVYEEANTKAEDQSAGSYLRSRALLHPESTVYGTQACRFTIFMQCGYLNELTNYTKLVPATLDCMIKKGIWQGANYLKGKPKGLPNSAVTVLKDINWFPVSDDLKQLSWDNALNYMQYYDMTSVHYPDVISVYPYLTSLLSDDILTDELIYIKHIIRYQWSKFAGVDTPIQQLIANIKDSVGKDIYSKLGNFIRAEVNPYQTDVDKELGYALTVEVPVYGTMPNRVWNVIVPVRRETTTE